MGFICFSDEFDAVCDIAPLVGTADLQLDAAFFIKHFIVDGLEDLVREFREGNARFQTGGDYVFRQHGIEVEKLAVVPEEVEQTDFGEPVIIIHHGKRAVFTEEFLHLLRERIRIMLYLFRGLEDTLRGASAGIADSARAPADKDDGMVAGKLEPFQNHERDQVADMHAVSCRIDTAVQGDGFFVHQFV